MDVMENYLNSIKVNRLIRILLENIKAAVTYQDRQELIFKYVSAAIAKAEENQNYMYFTEYEYQKMNYNLAYHKDAIMNNKCANENEQILSILQIYQITYKLHKSRTLPDSLVEFYPI